MTPRENLSVVRGGAPSVADDARDKRVRVVDRLNDEYALVVVGNGYAVLQETPGAEAGSFRFLSLDAFREKFRPSRLQLGDRAVSYATAWLNDARRRAYEGIVFAPGREVLGYYNLWRGFAVTPDADPHPAQRCARFLAHVRDNVCSGDPALADWVLGWFAHLVQVPHEKPGTALVLQGGQGTGKTLVGGTIGGLLGDHYALVSDIGRVTGRFNAYLASCLFLQLDEATWGGDHAAAGRLKDLITGADTLIEYKGREPLRVRNYTRLLVTSNNSWVVPAGLDERRFAVLRMGEGQRQHQAYFRAIVDELADGGREALLAYLLAFDRSTVDVRHVPSTAALHEQQLQSLESDAAWWRDVLERGVLPGDTDGTGIAPTSAVYAGYLAHAKERGISRRRTETELGIFLRHALRDATPPLLRRRGHVPDAGGGKPSRPYVYEFPTLARCRLAFAEQHGRHAEGVLAVSWTGDDAHETWAPDRPSERGAP